MGQSTANCSQCISNVFGGDELVNPPIKQSNKRDNSIPKLSAGSARQSQEFVCSNGMYFKREEHFETVGKNEQYNS
jgi:hypothetical protein